MAEIEESLRVEVSRFCRSYCLQVWNKALNQTRVDASSTLRRLESVYYPPAIQASGPFSSKAKTAPKDPSSYKDASANTLPSSTISLEEVVQAGAAKIEKDTIDKAVLEATKLPPTPKDSSKEKGAS